MSVRPLFIGGVGLVVLAAVGVLVAVRASQRNPDAAASPERVRAPPAAPAPWQGPPDEGLLGVLVPESTADIASRLEGQLERVDVQLGDEVRQGDVLAVLAVGPLRRELATAQAELLSAQAERQAVALALEQAQDKLKRMETPGLLTSGAVSEEELTTARYEQRSTAVKLDGAAARVQVSQSRVAKLEQEVADAQIRAPFDGMVASRLIDAGALVRPGQVLVRLVRRGARRVRFAVPEQKAGQVAVGRPVRVEVAAQGLTLDGRVSHVAPEVDAAARVVFALADLEDPVSAAKVAAGAVVRVHVAAGEVAGRQLSGTGAP